MACGVFTIWQTGSFRRSIQHNPNAASGRASVVKFFNSMKRPRAASCDKLQTPIVAVLAQGDLVTVVWPMT